MKIVHLSTSAIGGAGIVANRIAMMQKKSGDEVYFLSLDKPTNLDRNQVCKKMFKNRTLAKANTFISLITSNSKWTQVTPISISAGILLEIEQINPDVVHIHNWFNFLSYSDIESINRRYPLVFHIHDARLMTGGCHFTLDCNLYSKGCLKCPATKTMRPIVQSSFLKSKKLFENSLPYALIFPSNWLKRNFMNSPVYVNAKVVTNSMAPVDSDLIGEIKTENRDGIVCVITDLSAKVKGFDVFLQAIEILRIEGFPSKINVVGGNAKGSQINKMRELNVSYLGRLPSSKTLEIIANSELIVVPSFSENSPTVVVEAQLLKTSVLVTAIQGCLELVDDARTGYVCEPSPESMAEGIVRAFKNLPSTELRFQAHKEMQKKQVSVYSTINSTYEQIIKQFRKFR